LKRSPLVRKTPLQAKSPMRKRRSARARARDFSPSVREQVMERSGGICEICKQRPAVHMHHAVFRRHVKVGTINIALHLCEACHEVCHSTRAMREYAVTLAKELAGDEITKRRRVHEAQDITS